MYHILIEYWLGLVIIKYQTNVPNTLSC